MWCLSEVVGFSYQVTVWNKFIIVKWQFIQFFQLFEFSLNEIHKFIY